MARVQEMEQIAVAVVGTLRTRVVSDVDTLPDHLLFSINLPEWFPPDFSSLITSLPLLQQPLCLTTCSSNSTYLWFLHPDS